MFCDKVVVSFWAGKGGDGMVHFRREKYVPYGGPDGGDGGRGGSVILQVDQNINTLAFFNNRRAFHAEDGTSGGRSNRHGKDGDDLILSVPLGTQVYDDESSTLLIDLDSPQTSFVVVQGGRGGFGNAHFVSSTRQTPDFAEKGEVGQHTMIRFELKLVAEVGIIGIPSVGKSTLISRISHAKPKIADYPFTTLVPNLGVVDLSEFDSKAKGETFVVADVPGLIEGAHLGKGLGDDFLRHISRTRLLVHLLDANSDTILKDYETICHELEAYDPKLLKEEHILVINKIDLIDHELREFLKHELVSHFPALKKKIFSISAATGEGIPELVFHIWHVLQKIRKSSIQLSVEPPHVFRPHLEDSRYYNVSFLKKKKIPVEGEPGNYQEVQVFHVDGKRISQIVDMTDFDNDNAVARVYDVFEKIGVHKELEHLGARPGDIIVISSREIPYLGGLL